LGKISWVGAGEGWRWLEMFDDFWGFLDVEDVNLMMRNVENGGYWSTFDI
jgi:hypothetical protein